LIHFLSFFLSAGFWGKRCCLITTPPYLNTVGDIALLPRVLDAASRFDERLGQAELDPRLAQLGSVPLFV